MKNKKIGGIILFSEDMVPQTLRIGSITVLERIILNFQQMGLDPIVLVSDKENYYLVEDLKKYSIIYLYNEKINGSIDLLKEGINYLQDKCHAVFYSPAVIPMFKAKTLRKMERESGNLITPSYQHKSGHPVLIRQELYGKFLESEQSLRNTIRSLKEDRVFVNIEDTGVISSVDEFDQLKEIQEDHSNQLFTETVEVCLEKENRFFDERTKLLLLLLKEKNTMGKACEHIALSKRKGWDLINQMEKELGYKVVDRKHGGRFGGSTTLTPKGEEFLNRYLELENEIKVFAAEKFKEIFIDKPIERVDHE